MRACALSWVRKASSFATARDRRGRGEVADDFVEAERRCRGWQLRRPPEEREARVARRLVDRRPESRLGAKPRRVGRRQRDGRNQPPVSLLHAGRAPAVRRPPVVRRPPAAGSPRPASLHAGRAPAARRPPAVRRRRDGRRPPVSRRRGSVLHAGRAPHVRRAPAARRPPVVRRRRDGRRPPVSRRRGSVLHAGRAPHVRRPPAAGRRRREGSR